VTAPGTSRSSISSGLLEKLIAVVRPEFRIEVHLVDPDDPVLGRRQCAVAQCDRPVSENALCSGHARRWRDRDRPAIAVFLADPGPVLNGRRDLSVCTVSGCRYGRSGLGLCTRHRTAWTRDGQPDPGSWAAEAGLLGPSDPQQCGLPFCTVWTENAKTLYCKSHTTRWVQLGRPDDTEYLAHCQQRGTARIDFRGLAPQLKLELQYAVQSRHDQATVIAAPSVIAWAIRITKHAAVTSLLDLSAEQWLELAGAKEGTYQRFLIFARETVETLRDGAGWEVEYPRDIWRLHRLPGLTPSPGKPPHARMNLRFDRLTQPWLRTLVKRWARLRLSSGLSLGTVQNDLLGLTRFSTFLAESAPQVHALSDIDRALLERYLAWLATQSIGRGAKEDAVTAPGVLFQAIRQHDWDQSLPTTAVFFPGDLPARPPRLARHVAEHIMAQVEAPANLDRWPNPEGRLITIILIRCGLRATDACTLPFDCLLYDGQKAAYLRYFNNKMRREAAVPIDEDLESDIRAQQQRVSARWPGHHPHLFPAATRNAGGRHPMTYYSYRGMLNAWLTTCEVHDEHGQPAHLTPHKWRHTFACRLINRDVPQEVIRVLLDHESTQMTAHYARITDQTVRRRWEAATKVNIKGERVTIDPEGSLAQAQWAKTRYGMATQTLPNGYCGLPLQRTCPHANACLTCPVFLTGPEFLPELREQQQRTLTLIDVSERNGQARMVDMNQQVLTNLNRMISEVEKAAPEQETAHAG
jgi:integrase